MGRIMTVGLGMLVLLAGCKMPLQTESNVTANVMAKMHGKMEARVRSEVQQLVDPGPLHEVIVRPGATGSCGKIAVLDVDNILTNLNHVGPYSVGENPVATFKEKLDACAADPQVRAVVLRINTPGGGVAATDLMWHELCHFRQGTGKPVVACLLDLATGGGYFLATGCDSIVAIPSSVVGGIGVLLNVYFAKEGMAMINVFDDSIRAGEKIDMGSPVRKVSRDERLLLESMARGYHDRFKQVVLQARPRITADAPLFDGRVMSGPQAVEAGLVDAVGYLDDALALAARSAQVNDAQVVMYRREGDPARSLYATSPNRPIHSAALPLSIPGPDRSKLPLFLYMWQLEPTLLKLSGI